MKLKLRFAVCLVFGIAAATLLLLRVVGNRNEGNEYKGELLRRTVGVHFGRLHVPDVKVTSPPNLGGLKQNT